MGHKRSGRRGSRRRLSCRRSEPRSPGGGGALLPLHPLPAEVQRVIPCQDMTGEHCMPWRLVGLRSRRRDGSAPWRQGVTGYPSHRGASSTRLPGSSVGRRRVGAERLVPTDPSAGAVAEALSTLSVSNSSRVFTYLYEAHGRIFRTMQDRELLDATAVVPVSLRRRACAAPRHSSALQARRGLASSPTSTSEPAPTPSCPCAA
jgi:hypothetical protein